MEISPAVGPCVGRTVLNSVGRRSLRRSGGGPSIGLEVGPSIGGGRSGGDPYIDRVVPQSVGNGRPLPRERSFASQNRPGGGIGDSPHGRPLPWSAGRPLHWSGGGSIIGGAVGPSIGRDRSCVDPYIGRVAVPLISGRQDPTLLGFSVRSGGSLGNSPRRRSLRRPDGP